MPSRQPAFNWEQFVGVRLFAWLGGLALFFAAALGLKYSFDHNLIPPAVRAAAGFILGTGLLVGGVVMRRKEYAVTSQTLCATGVVTLYAVTFACRSYFHFSFFTVVPTFLILALITTTAFVLATRLNAQVVAVLGMLGGFLTPLMLSTGENNPLGLFGYLAVLNIGLIAVVRFKRWDYLLLLAMIGTLTLQLGWLVQFLPSRPEVSTYGVFLGMPLIFVIGFAWAWRAGWLNAWIEVAALVPPLVSIAVSAALIYVDAWANHPAGLFGLAFGADLLLLALVVMVPRLGWVAGAGAGVLFTALGLWMVTEEASRLMYWALGLSLLFGILHTVFPLVLQRLRPKDAQGPPSWTQCFPAVAVVLAFLPMLHQVAMPTVFWWVLLLIDGLAVLLGMVTGGLVGLAAVLLLTLIGAGFWIESAQVQGVELGGALALTAGAAVFFFVSGIFLWRRLPSGGFGKTPNLKADEVSAWIPPLSAGLPFLLLIMATGQFRPVNPLAIFGVAAFLVSLMFVLVRWAKQDALALVALGSVGLLEWVWHGLVFTPQHAIAPLAGYLGFYALFLVFPFFWFVEFRDRRLPWVASALAGPIQFALVYALIKEAFPNPYKGLVPAAFAVPSLVVLMYWVRRVPAGAPRRLENLAWFGGVTLLFVTLIFPIQFERQWLTLGWALEGAALCWLFRRVPHPALPVVGFALLTVAFTRLTLNPDVLAYHQRTGVPIWNWYLYAYTVAGLSCFVAARALAPIQHRILGCPAAPILQGLGTILFFLLVNIEIADYFGQGLALTFEFSGNFARDMTYTIAWALFAFGLVVVGIRRRAAAVRYAGLGLLCVALLKLFLHDLSELNQLYRIGAFAAVAVIAIVASFLYQRFLSIDNRTPVRTVPPEDPR